jgi:hypothetical protein
MGAWGTAIFSDDAACDVRDAYLELVGDGLSGAEATRQLTQQWSKELEDPDQAPVVWLALAATQWKCGRLEEGVREQALRVIDDRSDLRRWEDNSRELAKRKRVLEGLRARLLGPQAPERRIRKQFRDANEWKRGDVIAYRLRSGKFVVMRIIGHHSDKGGTSPVCEWLEGIFDVLPGARELQALGVRKMGAAGRATQFMLARSSAKQRPDQRLQVLGINLEAAQEKGRYECWAWKRLDQHLKDAYGIG